MEQAVVVVVTKPVKRGRPSTKLILTLGALATVMIVGFQNCAVDLSASTPGASTLGACGSPPPAALPALQNVLSTAIQTNCSTCHGVNSGSVKSGFYVPDAAADPASADVQSFTYTQLCARGGKAVGLKIDGSNSHGGGTFTRTGAMAPLFTYLDTYF
ncbi:hypothetical protein BH10BDE1_BH10BDE1_24220 [soil metagenome]